MSNAHITVIGGMVVDHIMVTNRLPDLGETFTANSYRKALGGKGGNSSIAIYRSCHEKPTAKSDAAVRENQLDIKVRVIGAVGKDDAGEFYKKTLEENGLDTSGIRMIDDVPTGTGFVIVKQDSRDNWLLGVLGANETFLPEDFASVDDLGPVRPDLIVAQLEIGMPAIEQMLETAGRAEIPILLNPSPANHVLSEKYKYIKHFVVNETEAAIYSGIDPIEVTEDRWLEIAKVFLADGVENVVITLGAAGAFFASKSTDGNVVHGHVPALKVQPVDTTGAGDTFTGAYASEYIRQIKMQEPWDIEKAVTRACKAAALTICTLGAQEGIPWADEIDTFAVSSEAPTAVDGGMTVQDGLQITV